MNVINKISLTKDGVTTVYDLVGSGEGLNTVELENRVTTLENTLNGVNEFLEELLNTY